MSNAIVDKYQSAYLPHRSTETALTLIINDIINKSICYLVLLYLSITFDTLDHNILSIGLNEIGIHSKVHIWFMYFVSSRTYSVKINSSLSPPYFNIDGVPKGSVLIYYFLPNIYIYILFIIYILPIKSIFHKYPNINYHLYADELLIYSHFLVLVILV